MANTIAACVGSKDIQSQVACPCTVGRPVTESLVKFNRKQKQEALRWVGLFPCHTYRYVFSVSNKVQLS
jgi:hypothetical protein